MARPSRRLVQWRHGEGAADVDVLGEFDPSRKTFDNFLALVDSRERLLDHRVELVATEALSPYIGSALAGRTP